MGRFIDLTGQRFGRLTVLGLAPMRNGVKTQWLCRCECGKTCAPQAATLRNGKAQSCGCLRVERVRAAHLTHGLHSAPEYMVWYQMHERCRNPAHKHFASYGGRGIGVCDAWQDLETFLRDMGPRPSAAHQLDRKDNDAGYSPENCRWATRIENASNKRTTVRVTLNGETMCLAEAARRTGIKPPTAYWRAKRGMTETSGLFDGARA